KRSPSKAPPVSGLCGSQANTATLGPCARTTSIILPISELLPTPPLPVKAATTDGCVGRGRPPEISAKCSPRAARLRSRARARRSPWRKGWRSSSIMPRPAGGRRFGTKESYDIVKRSAWAEYTRDPQRAKLEDIRLRNDAADQNFYMVQLRLAQ